MLKFALFALAAVLLAGCSHRAPAAATVKPSVELTTVRRGIYRESVGALGRIGAPAGSDAKLAFAESGILQSIEVQIGERVAAGEALARLHAGGFSLAASQAQADARAALANAAQSAVDRTTTRIAVDEAALRREQSLYAAGVAPLKDIQAARAQLAQDRADALVARASVSGAGAQAQSAGDRAALAQRDLYNATLRAAQDGVVTAIYKKPGESVDPSTPVVGIGPESSRQVTLNVSPADAARVRVEDAVDLSIPGTGLRSQGRVTGVSPAVDPATQTTTVIVSGIPTGAPPGSAVQATISVANDRGIVIPQTAIVQDPQSGDTLVFVQVRQKDGSDRFEQRTVIVDRENGIQALIRSGLRPGERIATQGAFALLAPSGS